MAFLSILSMHDFYLQLLIIALNLFRMDLSVRFRDLGGRGEVQKGEHYENFHTYFTMMKLITVIRYQKKI